MEYDCIIIGGGIAGLTASIYASRYKIKHLVLAKNPGGQGTLALEVENYPGFTRIKGSELMQKVLEQAKSYGTEVRQEEAKRLEKLEGGGGFEIKTEKEGYQTRSLILAMGADFRKLDIPGEEEFLGKGVSYCAVCDGPLFKDKVVAVVGGGNAAISSALHLAEFAKKVYLIHRRSEYRADPLRVEKLRGNQKIEEVLENEVREIKGREGFGGVEGVKLAKPYKGEEVLRVEGVFVEIGQIPASVLAKDLGTELDKSGYVKVDVNMATNVKGVFCAGDLAAMRGEINLRQFITAAADGARAAAGVYQYLNLGKLPLSSWG